MDSIWKRDRLRQQGCLRAQSEGDRRAAKTALFSVGRAVGGNEEVVEFVELVIELA